MSEKTTQKFVQVAKEIDKYESVCPMCGQRFDIEYEDEMALYIRNNAGFYLGKFDKMETQNTKITWNWACFLFTGLWLIYRKMYNWFAAFILFWIAEGFVLAALGNFGIIDTLLNIAVSVLMGMYGNYLYKEK